MDAAAITTILTSLIAAGLLTYLRDAFKAWNGRRHAASPDGRESARVGLVDQNLLVVSKARDELAEDNKRLRTTLAEERRNAADERARYGADRIAWDARETRYRGEVEALESKVRAILAELTALKDRLPPSTPPGGMEAVTRRY